jgi:RecA/RadA recombinase
MGEAPVIRKRVPVSTVASDAQTVINHVQEQKVIIPTDKEIQWVSTGCPTLNLALSGKVDKGIPKGRISNGVGGHTTGKTLMWCELANNIYYGEGEKEGKKVLIAVNEPENKFDYQLAADNQLPIDKMVWEHSNTIEQFCSWTINLLTENCGKYDTILIVLDALDRLDNARELKKDKKKGMGEQDYKVGIPTILSKFFHAENTKLIQESNCILHIVSQIRANVGAKPWESKVGRSGGNALDHSCTIIYWLRQMGELKHENGMVQGYPIEIDVQKNHAALPSRTTRFNILLGYGIDYIGSAVSFALDTEIIKPAGSWFHWEGINVGQGEKVLVPFFENNRDQYQVLLNKIQSKWDSMMEEAKIKRMPKWLE